MLFRSFYLFQGHFLFFVQVTHLFLGEKINKAHIDGLWKWGYGVWDGDDLGRAGGAGYIRDL